MLNNTEDHTLVREALEERNSFAAIVKKYDPPLRRYIRRLSSFDSETVDDILQESFIKIYLHLNEYDTSLPFSAWIYRITRNETINYFRRMKNQPRPLSSSSEDDYIFFQKISNDINIEHESDKTFDAAVMHAALNGLEFKYREVLLLRFFEEKSYDEISDILKMPPGTVAVNINRAKAKLKNKLAYYEKTF